MHMAKLTISGLVLLALICPCRFRHKTSGRRVERVTPILEAFLSEHLSIIDLSAFDVQQSALVA
jgi:hypothetical protein